MIKNNLIIYEPQNCIVYVHICKKLNKYNNYGIYFGITCQKVNSRWKKGKGYKCSTHFYNAIQKYGWDNFEHKVLFKNISLSLAKKIENFLILKNKTNNKQFGYNLTEGGEHNRWSKELRERVSKNKKGKPVKNFEKSRIKGKLNPNYGIKRDRELVEQIASKHRKKVICVETGIIYKSIKNAGELNNIIPHTIGAVCRDIRKTAGCYHWKFILE